MKGHFAKNNLPPMKFLREVEIVVDEENQDGAKVGDKVLVDMFDGTKFVDITGQQQGARLRGCCEASSLCRRCGFARLDVPDHRFNRIFGVSVTCVQSSAHVGTHGHEQGDDA